eukprot:4769847-Karenia_brevis.AAC.1
MEPQLFHELEEKGLGDHVEALRIVKADPEEIFSVKHRLLHPQSNRPEDILRGMPLPESMLTSCYPSLLPPF